MEYAIIILIALPGLYSLNYAKYNWKNGNRSGAVGVLLPAALSVIGPLLFFILT